MTLEIIASAVPSDDWDEFVVSAEGGTFCHLSGWRTIMEEVLGHEPLFLSARDHNGRLAGVLPLVGIRSRLFGRFLISMPFLNYGGPPGSAVARAALGQAAISAAQHRRADLLELRWRQRVAGVGPEALPLPATSELLWERGLSAKVRNQVRRPQKEGLTTVFGHDQVEPFIRSVRAQYAGLRYFRSSSFGDWSRCSVITW